MGRGDLASLIKARKGDRSYDQLERDAGGKPTAARWQQLAMKPQRNFPDPETIHGISRALRVTETEVVMAAARTLGIPVREDSHGSLSTAGLSQDQVHIVRMVIAALADARREDPSDGTPIADDDLMVSESVTEQGGAVLEVRDVDVPAPEAGPQSGPLRRTGETSKRPVKPPGSRR